MQRNILLILPAENFNETEFLITKKTLEDNGISVFIASDSNSLCLGKNGLKVKADMSLYNVHASNFKAVVLIGGSGVKKYWTNKNVHKILLDFNNNKKIVAAICSAPVAIAKSGLLLGKEATCYADDKDELESEGVVYVDQPVVISENIITGQNAGASSAFTKLICESI